MAGHNALSQRSSATKASRPLRRSSTRTMSPHQWSRYLDVPEDIRLARLVARHVAFGKDPSAALAWSHGSDQRNAELIAGTRDDADLIVRLNEA